MCVFLSRILEKSALYKERLPSTEPAGFRLRYSWNWAPVLAPHWTSARGPSRDHRSGERGGRDPRLLGNILPWELASVDRLKRNRAFVIRRTQPNLGYRYLSTKQQWVVQCRMIVCSVHVLIARLKSAVRKTTWDEIRPCVEVTRGSARQEDVFVSPCWYYVRVNNLAWRQFHLSR